ncbi:peptidoglycan DD-metalloendopeptidase family protein [Gelidibacter salicanalis]|uniref:Peptidoglycan DD-metalloendopeptidase family protein n=1 Tax=Gelidibacter salicanalis TaxID=291193 RepID=A0A934KR29_9FLAO|nr:peptidoglycan DD-metalloendopeptidase family protein [Gelidibacter salicanalis]MBJ7882259.1 peptidoglycan DD-metalloendopeptidase family protein [Gelidibacter salicanalis]
MYQRNIVVAIVLGMVMWSCKNEKENINKTPLQAYIEPVELREFGFNLNDYVVKKDTIRSGDSFGSIMQRHNVDYSKIYEIAESAKKSYDIRKLRAGNPYTLLLAKDSLQTPQCFIYQENNVDYVVIHFADSIVTYKEKKPITIVTKEASGVINNSLSVTMDSQGLPQSLIGEMADIYAWTINFWKLQKGDKFKIIYKQRFIEDSIYAGLEGIEAAYFQHKDEDFYAFKYATDSTSTKSDFYDEKAKSLKRAFLKAPVNFGRISSRYNLNRRIAYYGYALRPHKGTDFAAPIGTEILATANGTVVESTQRGGNGKYVKIKHSDTYSTQYLHMKAQKVKKGQFVKQGDVIGWVGMTGNTGGPHVCYRFWKNGKQVDPFKEKLPTSESIPNHLVVQYKDFIKPLRTQLDNIPYQYLNETTIEQGYSITKN